MLTTHNFRTLNPTVSQTPLCQTLKSDLPKSFITSATINLRRYVWVDGQTENLNKYEVMQAQEANQYYKQHKTLPEALELETELIDPVLNHLALHISTENQVKKYISISTAPCTGLIHEIICREAENHHVLLSRQQVEVSPERYYKHGQMITEHQGEVKSFLLPLIPPTPETTWQQLSEHYAILEFEIRDFNVATGLVGIGIPALTMFGLFVANFLQKELLSDLKFAVGFERITQKFKTNHYASNSNPNSLRKANIKGYLVVHSDDQKDVVAVFDKFKKEFRFSGLPLISKQAYISNQLPSAFWLHEIDADIERYLSENQGLDALDAAFHFAEGSRLTVPIATGFALLNEPVELEHIEIKHPHAWAEIIFKSMQISHCDFDEKLLFKRHFDKENLYYHWTQGND